MIHWANPSPMIPDLSGQVKKQGWDFRRKDLGWVGSPFLGNAITPLMGEN